MKKGFTLMEMLAVILVIAVVVSMAVPVFRSVRYEMKNSQAKAAAKKMAEAMKSFYQASRGHKVTGCFDNDTSLSIGSCDSPGPKGFPNTGSNTLPVSQLFACGYLSKKDFSAVPYEFCANDTSSAPTGFPSLGSATVSGKLLVGARGLAGAGKYKDKGFIFVDDTLTVKDTYGDNL